MEAAGVEPASGASLRRSFTRVSPVCVLPHPLAPALAGMGATSLSFAHHPRGTGDGLSGLVGALTQASRRNPGRTAT